MFKVYVDKEICIGCGACVFASSALFKIEEGKAVAKVKETSDEDVHKAAEMCPVNAITVTKVEES